MASVMWLTWCRKNWFVDAQSAVLVDEIQQVLRVRIGVTASAPARCTCTVMHMSYKQIWWSEDSCDWALFEGSVHVVQEPS